MASDEIVWQVINQQFCSFKLKATKGQTFCRNEYNVTGLCSRMSCPLANSNYATIRSDTATGQLHLYVKVVERSHLPSKLWERTRLSANYSKALAQIDTQLAYWPKFLIHKCKQRLTRLTQVAIKTKKLAKEQERLGETLVPRLAPKVRRREETRERKAEAAAKVERAIERELIERLRSGAYGDRPLNVEEGIWKKVLRGLEREGEGVRDKDLDEGIEDGEDEREEEFEDGINDVEYVSDLEGEDEEDDLEELGGWFDGESESESASEGESGDEDEGTQDSDQSTEGSEADVNTKPVSSAKRKRPPPAASLKKRKTPRVEIEYEEETIAPRNEAILAR